MTPNEVAAALAARTPGPWGTPRPGSPSDGMLWEANGRTIGSTLGYPTRSFGQSISDARAIVVAVTLADDLWRVAEAAQRFAAASEACRNAADAAVEEQGAAESFKVGYAPLDDALVEFVAAEEALCEALAALDATREELP